MAFKARTLFGTFEKQAPGPYTQGCPQMDTTWKRKQGRPGTTWRHTAITELKEMGLTLGEAQHAAKDRSRWRQVVDTLCPARDEQDKLMQTQLLSTRWKSLCEIVSGHITFEALGMCEVQRISEIAAVLEDAVICLGRSNASRNWVWL